MVSKVKGKVAHRGRQKHLVLHIKVVQRKRRNMIHMIKDEERDWIEDLV